MSGLIRWLLFAGYVGAFFVVPLGILWQASGVAIGSALAVSLLIWMRTRASSKISDRMGMREVSPAENPSLFQLVQEYGRRLNIPLPRVGIVDSPAVNLGLFGFSRRTSYLAITQGALQELPRESLAALVGRELSLLERSDFSCDSWLCQFLHFVEKCVSITPQSRRSASTPRFYPFRLFLKQIIFYPLCLVPCMLLRSKHRPHAFDRRAVEITRLAQPLAEGLRLMLARSERVALDVPFNCRHLFLLPPSPKDPLARIFFGTVELGSRIRLIEKISGVAPAL